MYSFDFQQFCLISFLWCANLLFLQKIRPLNCGRWVRETSDQKDTTWKMRRDGSRTWLPSPPCRYMHWLAQPLFGWMYTVFQFARLLCTVFPSFSSNLGIQGAGAETHRSDGRGPPQTSLLQWTHLPCQLHLCQQRWGDLPVCRRPPHQYVASGHHRPQLQYPFSFISTNHKVLFKKNKKQLPDMLNVKVWDQSLSLWLNSMSTASTIIPSSTLQLFYYCCQLFLIDSVTNY